MTALPAMLATQAALIAERLAEKITELRRREAECCMCGEGPADGRDLRAYIRDDLTIADPPPEMLCRQCFSLRDDENDFTDAPLIWCAIQDASR